MAEPSNTVRTKSPIKFILNILPAICFIATYYLAPLESRFIYATIAVVSSSLLCAGVSYALFRKIGRLQIVILVLLLIFALPTIYFNDPSFLKWKVSVVNIIMAIALGICQFVFKTDVARALSGIANPIPQKLWQKATILAMLFLCGCAVLNYVIAFHLPNLFNITEESAQDIWVNYKTYGNGILNFIFVMFAFNYVYGKLTPDEKVALERLVNDVKTKRL